MLFVLDMFDFTTLKKNTDNLSIELFKPDSFKYDSFKHDLPQSKSNKSGSRSVSSSSRSRNASVSRSVSPSASSTSTIQGANNVGIIGKSCSNFTTFLYLIKYLKNIGYLTKNNDTDTNNITKDNVIQLFNTLHNKESDNVQMLFKTKNSSPYYTEMTPNQYFETVQIIPFVDQLFANNKFIYNIDELNKLRALYNTYLESKLHLYNNCDLVYQNVHNILRNISNNSVHIIHNPNKIYNFTNNIQISFDNEKYTMTLDSLPTNSNIQITLPEIKVENDKNTHTLNTKTILKQRMQRFSFITNRPNKTNNPNNPNKTNKPIKPINTNTYNKFKDLQINDESLQMSSKGGENKKILDKVVYCILAIHNKINSIS